MAEQKESGRWSGNADSGSGVTGSVSEEDAPSAPVGCRRFPSGASRVAASSAARDASLATSISIPPWALGAAEGHVEAGTRHPLGASGVAAVSATREKNPAASVSFPPRASGAAAGSRAAEDAPSVPNGEDLRVRDHHRVRLRLRDHLRTAAEVEPPARALEPERALEHKRAS